MPVDLWPPFLHLLGWSQQASTARLPWRARQEEPTVAVAALTEETRPSLFRNRPFLSIWIGHTLSVVGDGFHSVALGLWVLQTTGSGAAMATIMAVRVVIGVLLGAVAGTLADRVNRRALMIGTDLIRLGLVLAVAALVATPGSAFIGIVALSALIAIASQFFHPAFGASLVNIVGKEDVPRASSLQQVTNTLAQVVGPFLGGMVVAGWGGSTALLVDAITFGLSALMILVGGHFPSPRREEHEQSSFWSEMREGFGYMWKHPLVRSLVTMAPVMNFFGNALGVLFPVIAVKVWLVNSVQFGALEGAFPLGFAIGAATLMVLTKRISRRGLLIVNGALMMGVFIMAIVNMPSANAALVLVPFLGLFSAVTNVFIQIIFQLEVAPEMQGRVFGTVGSLVNVASPTSMVIAGVLADAFSPVLIANICGVGLILVALYLFVGMPSLRNYR